MLSRYFLIIITTKPFAAVYYPKNGSQTPELFFPHHAAY